MNLFELDQRLSLIAYEWRSSEWCSGERCGDDHVATTASLAVYPDGRDTRCRSCPIRPVSTCAYASRRASRRHHRGTALAHLPPENCGSSQPLTRGLRRISRMAWSHPWHVSHSAGHVGRRVDLSTAPAESQRPLPGYHARRGTGDQVNEANRGARQVRIFVLGRAPARTLEGLLLRRFGRFV
jgi:hypothetical protein